MPSPLLVNYLARSGVDHTASGVRRCRLLLLLMNGSDLKGRVMAMYVEYRSVNALLRVLHKGRAVERLPQFAQELRKASADIVIAIVRVFDAVKYRNAGRGVAYMSSFYSSSSSLRRVANTESFIQRKAWDPRFARLSCCFWQQDMYPRTLPR